MVFQHLKEGIKIGRCCSDSGHIRPSSMTALIFPTSSLDITCHDFRTSLVISGCKHDHVHCELTETIGGKYCF